MCAPVSPSCPTLWSSAFFPFSPFFPFFPTFFCLMSPEKGVKKQEDEGKKKETRKGRAFFRLSAECEFWTEVWGKERVRVWRRKKKKVDSYDR